MSGLAEIIAGAKRDVEIALAAEAGRDRYRTDPVSYCRDVLRFDPWSKQRDVLESVRDHKRTAVRSSHGTGKTAIAARVALWFLDSFENSRVITTAPTWAQVKDLLWREIHVAHHAAGGRIGGRLHDTGLELAPDWFAVGLSTNEPERFQGHHAEHLLLIVDESSGVSNAIFNAAQGFLTAHGARLLLLGNPTQLSGEFFDAFHTKRAAYSLISISTFDTPAFTGEKVSEQVDRALPTPEWVEEMRKLYGESSPLWNVRVLGEFARQPDDSVIALDALEAAQARVLEPKAPVVIACDVARFGSDETAIAVRRGSHVRLAKVLSGRDTMQTVGELIRVAKVHKDEALDFPTIVIDDAGLGGGVTDRLRELKREGALGSIRIVAFNAADSSKAKDDYPNRRSEIWFEFAEQLETLDLDSDEHLAADLVAPLYRLDSRGRRVVEAKADTKKRLGRSPDRADAVLMTFAVSGRARGLTLDEQDVGDGLLDDGVRYDMAL